MESATCPGTPIEIHCSAWDVQHLGKSLHRVSRRVVSQDQVHLPALLVELVGQEQLVRVRVDAHQHPPDLGPGVAVQDSTVGVWIAKALLVVQLLLDSLQLLVLLLLFAQKPLYLCLASVVRPYSCLDAVEIQLTKFHAETPFSG